MPLIFANQALLPDGWAENVLVTIDGQGRIGSVKSGARQDADHNVGILLPSPVNAHSHAFQRAMAGLTESRGPDPNDSFWTWRQLMFRFLDALSPDDIEAAFAAADVEVLQQNIAAAFQRLTGLVKRTTGDDRTKVRSRLIELFELFDPADPRSPRGRRNLANALY